MEELRIEPYTEKDLQAAWQLVVDAFYGKFGVLTDLDAAGTAALCSTLWPFSANGDIEGHYLLKEGEEVVGSILLSWKPEPGKSAGSAAYGPAIGAFGLRNVLKLTLGMEILEHRHKDRECYVGHLAVSEGHRGKGYGRKLMQFAKKTCLEDGRFDTLSLHVAAKNRPAVHLYHKLGFHVARKWYSGINGRLYNDPYWFLMVWDCR
ncbi:GNAT family N-acetyltransferase [Ruminococcaceae bacterium OttesenSCG-928-I18]|nr:GNAT family N-acetyltransferase [Ruminococcaceae bacterium OttesenSCG-928-I18]